MALTEGALAWRKESLLGRDWLERWERSGARYPFTLSGEQEPEMLERVRKHPQFNA